MLRELRFEAMRKRRRLVILDRLEAKRLQDDGPLDFPVPKMPTGHWAGSREKIEAMRERVERGEAIFHPEDCRHKVEKLIEAFQVRFLA